MKLKILIILLLGCVQNLLAQTDVTSTYLANPTFNESPNYLVGDAASNLATNGDGNTAHDVSGWTKSANVPWSTAASFEYGTSVTLNGSTVPATGSDGTSTGTGQASVGISVGWGGIITFSQEATLPIGTYTIKYKAYNAATPTQGNCLVGWTSPSVTKLSSRTSFPSGEWISDEVTFAVTSETTGSFQVGLGAVSNGSTANAMVFFDDVTVEYTAPASDDATLASLTVEPGVILGAFDPVTTSYEVLVAAGVTSVNVSGTTTNPNASITSGDGAVDVSGGSTADIVVTAQDGTTTKTYTLNFTVNYISGWDGNGLTGAGESAPDDFGWESTSAAIPWADANSGGGCRYRDGLTSYTNESDGSVNSGRQLMFRWDSDDYMDAYYTYPVTLEANTAYEFSLDHLLGGSASAPGTITVGVGSTKDGSSMIHSESFETTSSTAIYRHSSIVFYAENAGVYYMTFSGTRAWYGVTNLLLQEFTSSDASLSSLSMGGGDLDPAFDPETIAYSVVLAKGTTNTTVVAEPTIIGSSVTGTGQVDISSEGGTIDVQVTALDDVTTQTYSITYTVETVSSDATLGSLALDFGELAPSFDPQVTSYVFEYPVDSASVEITAAANYPGAAISGDVGAFTLSDGAMANITVTAENGTNTKQYSIQFDAIYPPSMAKGSNEFTTDGTWCWFQDPRAVYYEGEKRQTYTGWITSDGKVQVGSYNHDNGEILTHTLKENFQIDDHNNPTFLIREDGRIIVAYSGHFFGPMRVQVSENPEDITSWGPEANFGDNVTYANPYQIGDSTVMFYRDGVTWHPTINVSMDGGVTWGTPHELIKRDGSQNRPYAKYTQDSQGGMHITFTDGHPRQETSNKIYYVYFKNSKFYKADGTLIKEFTGNNPLYIEGGEPEVVYNASEGKGWTWDIALDENEQPVILYAAFPDNENHNYYYAHWNGTAWDNNHIVNSGRWFPQTPEGGNEPEPNYSGGMSLDPEDVSTLYLSKQVDGVFEIFKYTTQDFGLTWESEAITENTPEGTLNVRPVVPRGHKPGSFEVMWMRGWYTTYQNYHTSIMYYSPGDQLKYFDFGTTTSAVDTSAVKVSASSVFNGDYGFESLSGLAEGTGSGITNATEDYVSGSAPGVFKVALLNGTYTVTVTQGNLSTSLSDLSISANGELKASGINISADASAVNAFEVNVTDGMLSLTFDDEGETDDFWNVNALLITNESFSASNFNIVEEVDTLYEKQSIKLHYNIAPSSLENVVVSWGSSDETIATVTDGEVTALRPGVVWVTGAIESGTLFDSCKIVVDTATYIIDDVVFDFGTSSSPLAVDAVRVDEATGLNGSYGWLETSGILSRDRGSETSAERDFVLGTTRKDFVVYLPNGNYHLTTTHGDRDYLHDSFSTYANDELLHEEINSGTNEFVTRESDVDVTDNILVFGIQDDGGSNEHWVLNQLAITENVSSDNASLDVIYLDGARFQEFTPETLAYDIVFPYGTVDVPVVTAEAKSDNADVVINEATSLPGVTTVVVTAENGMNTQTYTINFDVEENDDATLSDLKVNGSMVVGFQSDVYTYNYYVGSDATDIPEVVATATDAAASVVITDATSLPGTTTVEVTAEDGTTILTYTVNFTVIKSTDATLSALKVNSATVSGFDAETLSYDEVLPPGTTEVPAVTATLSDLNATMVIADAASLPGSTTVEVTAEDGTTTQIYTINFTVAISTDASLSDLTVDGTMVSGFDASTLSYDVELPIGTTMVPTVAATLSYAGATMVVTDAASLPGATTVEVTAEDGTTSQTYNINFTVAKSTDASLSDLTVDGTMVTGFDASTLSYDVELPIGTTEVPTVAATLSYAGATMVVTDAASLPGAATVQVTAEDGTTQTYTVNFTVKKSTDASLSDLTVDGTMVTGFDASTLSYDVELPIGTTIVPTAAATLSYAGASMVVTDAASLPGTTTVEVTAEDGTTTQIYMINFTVAKSTEASLSDLTVDGTTISGFDAGTLSYDVELAAGTTTVPTVAAIATDANATLDIVAATSLPGSTTVEVTAEDGTTTQTYTINFTVAKSTDASLSDLTVDGTTISGFDASTLIYDVELAAGTTTVPTVAGIATDANATLGIVAAMSLPGSTTVEVVAEDNTTTQVYTINFSVANDPLSNVSEDKFEVYPNPTVDWIRVDLMGDIQKNASMVIYDLYGNSVWSSSVKANQNKVDVGGFRKGVYLIVITNGAKVYQQKVLKR